MARQSHVGACRGSSGDADNASIPVADILIVFAIEDAGPFWPIG
jgi:hypothetical protein